MESGFLNKPYPDMEWGLLKDERSNAGWGSNLKNSSSAGMPSSSGAGWGDSKGTSSGRIISSGGWEACKRRKEGDGDKVAEVITSTPDSSSRLVIDGPYLPLCIRVPKQAIQVWYSRKYKNLIFQSNDCFQCWDDSGPAHSKCFTSIFTCPVTGERFLSGSFGNQDTSTMLIKVEAARKLGDEEEDRNVSICWYKKKKEANNAAAARALDSLSYRDGQGSYGLCKEEPYYFGRHEDFLIPSSAPQSICNERIIPEPTYMETVDRPNEVTEDEDSDKFRENYRSIRGKMDIG